LADGTISVIDFVDDPAMVEHNGQLRVTVTHTVDTFFYCPLGRSIDRAITGPAQC
jgi:hypothetical protein